MFKRTAKVARGLKGCQFGAPNSSIALDRGCPGAIQFRAMIIVSASGQENVRQENGKSSIFLSAGLDGRNDDQGPISISRPFAPRATRSRAKRRGSRLSPAPDHKPCRLDRNAELIFPETTRAEVPDFRRIGATLRAKCPKPDGHTADASNGQDRASRCRKNQSISPWITNNRAIGRPVAILLLSYCFPIAPRKIDHEETKNTKKEPKESM